MKTRLVSRLGRRGAAELYRAFLEDMLRVATSIPGVEVELWLEGMASASAPPPGVPAPPEGRTLRIRRQRGDDLGARLANAFERSFREGAERALVVGTDHPTLPPALLERGISILERVEVAWGPSADGGYWGLALRTDAWPRAAVLFREIPWSTAKVLERTRDRAREAALRWRELPSWYDVDEPADLERLARDLHPASRTAETLARLRRGSGPEGGDGERR